LGSTPASLIASASDLATLGKEFELLAAPSEAGVDWVVAKPKVKDSSLQQVRIGLRSEDGQMVLAHLDIVDAFGTRSQMRFDKVQVNPSQLTASQFNFVPPKGADVVRP
jgi:outer membrane lipoprotein carrier protein